MKYNWLLFLIFTFSCTSNYTKLNIKEPYNSKGFALVYTEQDFKNKIITKKMNPELFQVSHQNLKTGTQVKIINSKSNDFIVLKNTKRIKYPDFYKILITRAVADKLNLDKDLPLVEILEIKKNKSFIAKKAKIYNEEKKISSNAPITSVKISNISKNKNELKNISENKIYIVIATFYSKKSAIFLKQRISNKISNFDNTKLSVVKKNNKEINLLSGPYKSVNLMKNDYIQLKNFGFEEMDIIINE